MTDIISTVVPVEVTPNLDEDGNEDGTYRVLGQIIKDGLPNGEFTITSAAASVVDLLIVGVPYVTTLTIPIL